MCIYVPYTGGSGSVNISWHCSSFIWLFFPLLNGVYVLLFFNGNNYWWCRPFGCGVILGGYDRDGPQLYMVEPSGVSYVSWYLA